MRYLLRVKSIKALDPIRTTITMDEIKAYQADPEVQRLNQGIDMIGGRLKAYLLGFRYFFPLFLDLVATG